MIHFVLRSVGNDSKHLLPAVELHVKRRALVQLRSEPLQDPTGVH